MKLKPLLNISIVIALFISLQGLSQNLVRKWSFEDTVSCPTAASQINKARYWYAAKGGGGSSDLYSICNNSDPIIPMVVGVPINWHGYQHPK